VYSRLKKMIRMNRSHFKWLSCVWLLGAGALAGGCVNQQGLGSVWGDQTPRDDHDLALKIRRAMDLDPNLKHSLIDVKSEGGRVKLEGVVDSPLKAVHAEGVAATIVGVVSVKNKIRVVVSRENSREAK
jgi:hypothetical protein